MTKHFYRILNICVIAAIGAWGCTGGKKAAAMPETVMVPEADTNAIAAADINISTGAAVTAITNVDSLETMTIGGKTWLKRNLDVATIRGSGCHRNNPDMCAKYGRLYTWFAAMQACEGLGDGWRLPDTADWNALIEAVGGWEIAGTRLKSKTDWKLDNKGNTPVGTDTFGFSALPGGYGYFLYGFDDIYGYVGDYGFWWSATWETCGGGSHFLIMGYYGELTRLSCAKRDRGFSVRCVRD